ncbi:hypothetical protein [Brucella intermedia]|uniref:hypothetical protein n=1 Tax=Brucella intermedia TaxID=94625 RepID=UPI00235F3AAD|nr:hypothetical protein [Brucella intermedia]
MMLVTPHFTEALKTGTEFGKRFDELTRQLASLMGEMYDGKCRIEFSHELGYVFIVKK